MHANRKGTVSEELAGKVVVVPVQWSAGKALAERLSAQGATVVLVGPDADEAGRAAAAIETAGLEGGGSGRPAVFVADGSPASLDDLAGFLAEMFRSS